MSRFWTSVNYLTEPPYYCLVVRFEPSSRTTLMDEQSNPWELLHPQDVMSRHRGAEQGRRCGILSIVSNGIDYIFVLF